MENSERSQSQRGRPEHYRFGKVIGEGSFSTVYLAKCIDSSKEFAIKVCQKKLIIKERKQEYVKREKSALHLLSNVPGICNLSCTFQDATRLYFVLSYAKNGELLKFLKNSISLECCKFYAAELLLAIEEMHKKNIIHRDLKPENLLLNRGMHLMVADFGSSKILPEDYEYDVAQEEIEKSRADESNDSNDSDSEVTRRRPKRRASFVGTAQYVSPEILKGNAPHLSTDLWAFGCIIYQMLAGVPPFSSSSEYLIFQKVLSCDLNFPENFDEDAKDLITKLLRFDPKTRIGSNDLNEVRYITIRKHKFFDGINFSRLRESSPPEMKLQSKSNESDEEFDDQIEPGLCSQRETTLLLGDFASSEEVQTTSSTKLENLLEQQKTKFAEWIEFVEPRELILKHGYIFKKKGLFPRKRMFLLTNFPRLIYIDATNPNNKIAKGEIPFSEHLRTEIKSFKVFLVHTPSRIYFLEEPEGNAMEWADAIENTKKKYILGKESFENEH